MLIYVMGFTFTIGYMVGVALESDIPLDFRYIVCLLLNALMWPLFWFFRLIKLVK